VNNKILVVEDNKHDQDFLIKTLQQCKEYTIVWRIPGNGFGVVGEGISGFNYLDILLPDIDVMKFVVEFGKHNSAPSPYFFIR